jgi:hypothetical protein
MTPARRLAQATMVTTMALCAETGIARDALYRFVGADRFQGARQRLLDRYEER